MLTNGYAKIKTLRIIMLSIISTLIVGLSSVIVFFIDESKIICVKTFQDDVLL